jgi:predicted transcriptional regulator of viral defense system
MICMGSRKAGVEDINKGNMFNYFETMIHSSTRDPKFMSISTVKVADILGVQPVDIEQTLAVLVKEGKLLKSTLQAPPHEDIYMLPSATSPS